MPSSHLILCRPLFLVPPTPPSIRVFSNESALRMRWPKYWSFSFSISPSNEQDWSPLGWTGWISLQSNQLYSNIKLKLYFCCFLKARWEYVISLWTSFILAGGKVTRWYFGNFSYQFFESSPSGVHVLVVSMQFYLVGVLVSAKQLKDLAQDIIALEEELNFLDFVLWLNYYSFVFLEYFPLVLHFLTSLIQFALWNSREDLEANAFLKTRGSQGTCGGLFLGRTHAVLLGFNTTFEDCASKDHLYSLSVSPLLYVCVY